MEYLFDKLHGIKEELKNKHAFIFLDFDGTVTPIVETPDKAAITEKARKLLEKISQNPKFKLAFISGRKLKDIKAKIGLKNLIYAGNNGLEIEGEKIEFSCSLSEEYKSLLGRIKDDLSNRISSTKGAFIEDKDLTLSLHYRLVDEKDVRRLKLDFIRTISPHLLKNQITIKKSKKVLEIRPPVEWDKGKAVLLLLTLEPFASKNSNVFPIYIGDDRSDEDAFRVLVNQGLTVFVGKPGVSLAHFYLRDTNEVIRFLKELLKL